MTSSAHRLGASLVYEVMSIWGGAPLWMRYVHTYSKFNACDCVGVPHSTEKIVRGSSLELCSNRSPKSWLSTAKI